MPNIRILPDQLANQIAAGEVVERPASVVKELLENSLDAGADRIEIEIEGGGTRLIRIIDNGEGMDEEDLLLSLERHGTSKISSEEDLTQISTLGFRGEAIPSISSVSNMVLTSRRPDNPLGTRVELRYGTLVKVHEAGCSSGTSIEVRNLFGNTPARRKFLRTVRTELNHIEEVVKNNGLARPDVSFILMVNGRQNLYLDQTLSLPQRLATIMRYRGDFMQVGDPEATDPDRRLFGFLIPPEKLTIGPSKLRLFVNGRAIKDRMMAHGVAEGLRGFLMKGKNPAGLIHLVLPPTELDVNVHPAKHEVRFHRSREVHTLISQTVAEAMRNEQKKLQSSMFKHNLPDREQIPLDAEQRYGSPSWPDTATLKEKQADQEYASQHIDFQSGEQATTDVSVAAKRASIDEKEQPVITTGPQDTHLSAIKSSQPAGTSHSVSEENALSLPLAEAGNLFPQKTDFHGLQVLGQLDDLYIFCQDSQGLLVIDQHAAHERLVYEQLRQQYAKRAVSSQHLLFPVTVELTVFQSQLVELHEEELTHMGFAIREFGGTSYIISAVPALAGQCDPQELLADVLEQFGSENSRRETGDMIDMIIATMACKAAVKAGTSLEKKEIDALLQKMAGADLFSHCPHGRPVVKRFSLDEIKKWFYRT